MVLKYCRLSDGNLSNSADIKGMIKLRPCRHTSEAETPIFQKKTKNTSNKCFWTNTTVWPVNFEGFIKWGLKGEISIDADSGPLRHVLWCSSSMYLSPSVHFYLFTLALAYHTVIQIYFFYFSKITFFWSIGIRRGQVNKVFG